MKVYRENIELSEKDKAYFENNEYGLKLTGEALRFEHETGESHTFAVFKGEWTPHGYIRDCGDHYIKACYSCHLRIDKDTLDVRLSDDR